MKFKIFTVIIIFISVALFLFSFSMNIITECIYEMNLENKIISNDTYFAILEIPKIDLKRELYDMNDNKNNVNDNILVHKNSIFPDNNKSNIILAGHSGNGNNAYFRYLYKLRKGDAIKLYFNNLVYEYEISEIEYQEKTGNLFLKQDFENMITLITCTYNNKKTQTIYYAFMKNNENIAKI